jgi:hypothetical protein
VAVLGIRLRQFDEESCAAAQIWPASLKGANTLISKCTQSLLASTLLLARGRENPTVSFAQTKGPAFPITAVPYNQSGPDIPEFIGATFSLTPCRSFAG